MKLSKALRRDEERNKRKYGHRTDNRNVFLIQEEKIKRAEEIKKKRLAKEQERDSCLNIFDT